MNRWAVLCAIIAECLTLSTYAAQMGRQMVKPENAASVSGGVEVRNGYSGPKLATRAGLDVGFDWSAMHWKAGDGHSDQTWSPHFGLTYGATEMFDLRLTGRYFSLEDGESDLQALRIGLGTRAWIPVGHDFVPYAGVGLNYYILDGQDNGTDFNDTRGGIGLSIETGAAYLIDEWISVRLGLQAEATVVSGKTSVAQDSNDVSLQGVGLSLGLNMFF